MYYTINPLMGIFSSPFKEEYQSYSFEVNHINDINFKKIQDDLSYQDPLRIVKFKNEVYAVVHHTILDKYVNSNIILEVLPDSINKGYNQISEKDIGNIIDSIIMIKQSTWHKRRKFKKKIQVNVAKVNIDFRLKK